MQKDYQTVSLAFHQILHGSIFVLYAMATYQALDETLL